MSWPRSGTDLLEAQTRLGRAVPPPWEPPHGPLLVAGCFVSFAAAPGPPGAERAWAAASLLWGRRLVATTVAEGLVQVPYEAGLLALREGHLLQQALETLPERPEVLLVNATGRDHPRGAGLALHLGAVLDLPSVGVTHRPLYAAGVPPDDLRGSSSPLVLDDEVVAYWLRTRPGARPVVAHAGWRTTPEIATKTVMRSVKRARTAEPLRRARFAARMARVGREAGGFGGAQRPVEPNPPSPRPEGGSSETSSSSACSTR